MATVPARRASRWACVGAALAIPVIAAPAVAWGPPQVVVPRTEVVAPTLAGGRAPALVWWARDEAGRPAVRARVLDGSALAPGRPIATPRVPVSAPAAVTRDGTPWVVWNDGGEGGPRVVALPLVAGGHPELSVPGPGLVRHAAAAGGVLAVATTTSRRAHLIVRGPGGAWGAPWAIPATPAAPLRVAAAADGTAALATDRGVGVIRPDGAGRWWRYPLPPGAALGEWDVEASAGGVVTVGWTQRRGGRVRAAAAVLGPGGVRIRHWGGRGVGLATGVTLAPAAGGTAMVWADQAGVHRAVRTPGAGWGPPRTLVAARCANARPVGEVATTGGTSVVVWTDDAGLFAVPVAAAGHAGRVSALATGQRSLTWAAAAAAGDGVVVAWRHAPRASATGEATEVVSAVRTAGAGLEVPALRPPPPRLGVAAARRVGDAVRVTLRVAAPGRVTVMTGPDGRGTTRTLSAARGRPVVTLTGPGTRGAAFVTAYDPARPTCPHTAPVDG